MILKQSVFWQSASFYQVIRPEPSVSLTRPSWRFQSLDENGFYIRGSINLWQKQYDSAIVNFTEVTKFQNHHNDVLTLRGLAYFLKGEYQLAKVDLISSIDLNEKDMTAIFTLGIVNLRLNEKDEAYKNLKKAEALGHPLAKSTLMRYLKDYRATGCS